MTKNGDIEKEMLQVITVGVAGRAQVRVLHWESGKPDEISNNQVRYSYDNLVGSSGLEVDGDGQLISLEEYYPYGGTSVWAARSQIEADYKTIRYSGKERDATGLYYYGYRYYQPWVARWLSADPAGTGDGLNLFRMVRNNPIVLFDPNGRESEYVNHSELPTGTKLSEIAMLGSHDAGTYAYSREKNRLSSVGALFPGMFKTQNRTLRQQAEAGARYFDIRVAQNKDGTFGFFHGPSVAGGNAVSDVKSLLEHAAGDSNNFYLLKLVFKGESGKSSAAAASNTFLRSILEGHRERLITHDDVPSLGEATVDLLHKGKNIGIMVDRKKYDGTERHWDYKESVNTEWANSTSAEKTAAVFSKILSNAKQGVLNILQTNMPVLSPNKLELSSGVKSNLFKNKGILIEEVENLLLGNQSGEHPAAIVSTDYVGDPEGTTSSFMATINQYNRRRMGEVTRL